MYDGDDPAGDGCRFWSRVPCRCIASASPNSLLAATGLNVDPLEVTDDVFCVPNVQGFHQGQLRVTVRLWLGVRATAAMDLVPSIGEGCRRDLRSAGWKADTLAERCVFSSLAGALLPFIIWALLSLRGIGMPLVLPIWVGLIGASSGAFLPILVLKSEAKKARRQARRVVGCFLDLVVLALAGGLGIEGALHAAAAIGDTPVSNQMIRRLEEARDAGARPGMLWSGLDTNSPFPSSSSSHWR